MSLILSEFEMIERKQEACLSCQRCCQTLAFQVPMHDDITLDEGVVNFYKVRGCIAYSSREMGFIVVEVPMPCPHLKKDGCDIYESRPSACSHYDGLRDPRMSHLCKWRELK